MAKHIRQFQHQVGIQIFDEPLDLESPCTEHVYFITTTMHSTAIQIMQQYLHLINTVNKLQMLVTTHIQNDLRKAILYLSLIHI